MTSSYSRRASAVSPRSSSSPARLPFVVRVLLCEPPSCAVWPSMTSSYSRRASAVSPRSSSINASALTFSSFSSSCTSRPSGLRLASTISRAFCFAQALIWPIARPFRPLAPPGSRSIAPMINAVSSGLA